jgi:hypothetical protein
MVLKDLHYEEVVFNNQIIRIYSFPIWNDNILIGNHAIYVHGFYTAEGRFIETHRQGEWESDKSDVFKPTEGWDWYDNGEWERD